jgi:hypothetical protein
MNREALSRARYQIEKKMRSALFPLTFDNERMARLCHAYGRLTERMKDLELSERGT